LPAFNSGILPYRGLSGSVKAPEMKESNDWQGTPEEKKPFPTIFEIVRKTEQTENERKKAEHKRGDA
jgi:hypothetical protein